VNDKQIEALIKFADVFLPIADEMSQPVYGVFHGGDPRNFSPDPEASTEAERKHHEEDCEKWAKTERENIGKSDCESLFNEKGELQAVVTHSQYGLGVNCDGKLQEIVHYARQALKGGEMKRALILIAALAVVGCGKTPEWQTHDEHIQDERAAADWIPDYTDSDGDTSGMGGFHQGRDWHLYRFFDGNNFDRVRAPTIRELIIDIARDNPAPPPLDHPNVIASEYGEGWCIPWRIDAAKPPKDCRNCTLSTDPRIDNSEAMNNLMVYATKTEDCPASIHIPRGAFRLGGISR
jgi:hypothetical protein